MTLSEALIELDTCEWLKISNTSVHASRWSRKGHGPDANVQIRRKKGESFEQMIIRAASLVQAGHQPTHRVPPRTSAEKCACGRKTFDLVWVEQLKQRLCRPCAVAWHGAAKNNDMQAPKSDDVM
jgi:hypothetical protein